MIKDSMLIKVNEKKLLQRKKNNGQRNKLRIKTVLNNIVLVTLSLSRKS